MKNLTRIVLLCAVLTAFLCAAAYAGDTEYYALVERIRIENSDASGVLSQVLGYGGVPDPVTTEPVSTNAPCVTVRITNGTRRTLLLTESKAYRTDGPTPAEDTINENFRPGKIVRCSAVDGGYKLSAIAPAFQSCYDGASVSRYVTYNGMNVKCAVLNNTLYGFQINGEIVTADANTTFVVSDDTSGKTKTYVGIDNTPDIYGCPPYENPVGYAYCEGNVAKIVYFPFCAVKHPDVSIHIPYTPLVDGHAITEADLGGLEEIAVPVQASFDAPTNVTLFASFYGKNNKYIGMGATSASVDSETSFVIMPVEDVVTGAETLKIAVTDADFRPLSEGEDFSLTGGGSGGGGSGGWNTTKTYYLNAAANLVYEDGGISPGYLMTTEPTEDTDLSEAYPSSVTLQQERVSPFFQYYVIFTPKELAYPRIIQGPASGVARVSVTLKAAPDAVVYRIWTYSGSSVESDAPTVTMKGAFRRDASGGGGGSSSGGLDHENETPILSGAFG